MPSQQVEGRPQIEGLPPNSGLEILERFGSLNTQAARSAIGDQEFSWLENLIPIGDGNLRSLYGPGTNLYTAAGKTISNFVMGNIGTTFYAFVFQSDGSAVQVQVSNGAQTTIGAASTFTGSPGPTAVQWGNQYLLIIDVAKGYFIWDGTVLYKQGSLGPSVQFLSLGEGYTSNPTIGFNGGHGSGAAGTATETNGAVTAITLTNPGSGYVANDVVVITFTGGGGKTTATGTATVSGGAVTGISVGAGGTGYTATTTVTLLGGGGAGATATATVSGGAVTGFTVTNGGFGYTSAPTVLVQDVNNPIAVAIIFIMPIGLNGTGIETFQGRVWVINGNTVVFSSPNAPSNFSSGNGAGAFTSQDPFLRAQYVAIKQSNGFLYLVGDSSINVISNVQTINSITTFNNQNVDPQVGTTWRDSVVPFGRALMLANPSGVYALYGGSVDKVSGKALDGLFSEADFSLVPSAGLDLNFSVKSYKLLVKAPDPDTGTMKYLTASWNGDKWFLGNQNVTLNSVTYMIQNSLQTMWGTDGTHIFQLFATSSSTLPKKLKTKLWSNPSIIFTKTALRFSYQIQDNSGGGAVFTANIDSENTTQPINLSGTPAILTFINNSMGVLQFQNNTPANINFAVSAFSVGFADAVQAGKLLGLTVQSTSKDFTFIHLGLLAKSSTPY